MPERRTREGPIPRSLAAVSQPGLYGAVVMLDEGELVRLIAAAGYDPEASVAVGVGSPSLRVAVHGPGVEGRFDGCDAIRYVGSLAKQFTGACAVLLVQERELDLEAPIATWLPELPRWAAAIRVRHLVHHTAASPSTGAVWERMERAGGRDWTSDGVIAALSTFPELEERPGAAYAYSNVGYVCLARIVERLTRASLDAFARERFFEPFGMKATAFWSGPAPSPPQAAPELPLHPAPLSVGDGGLWTSVRDLLAWNDALLSDDSGLSAVLHEPGALDDGTVLDYAWGIRVTRNRGVQVESHGGSWESTTARLVRLRDLGVGFAVLARDGSVERMTVLSSALEDLVVDLARH
jgi:CubicO group peptidase (beta-lactamase class C family)